MIVFPQESIMPILRGEQTTFKLGYHERVTVGQTYPASTSIFNADTIFTTLLITAVERRDGERWATFQLASLC